MNREAMHRILSRPKVRLDWEAIEAVANGQAATHTRQAWDLFTRPPNPRTRLWTLLDTWAGMDEATWPEANVKALYDDIMDIFRDHHEANDWFMEWRRAHPAARLA